MELSDRYAGTILAFLVIGGYGLLLASDFVTNIASIQGITDLYLGTTLLGLVIGILVVNGVPERTGWPELGAFALGGVATGYVGLSALSIVPRFQYVSAVGDVSLLVGGLFILYRIGFRPETT